MAAALIWLGLVSFPLFFTTSDVYGQVFPVEWYTKEAPSDRSVAPPPLLLFLVLVLLVHVLVLARSLFPSLSLSCSRTECCPSHERSPPFARFRSSHARALCVCVGVGGHHTACWHHDTNIDHCVGGHRSPKVLGLILGLVAVVVGQFWVILYHWLHRAGAFGSPTAIQLVGGESIIIGTSSPPTVLRRSSFVVRVNHVVLRCGFTWISGGWGYEGIIFFILRGLGVCLSFFSTCLRLLSGASMC